jgi:hypothetical protein
MVTFKHRGDFKNLEKFIKDIGKLDLRSILESYGGEGVRALSAATPADSGATASSWNYSVNVKKGTISISWTNSNMAGGVPVAVLLQYGHGTRNGGYVQGRDYINPALRPIFDKLAEEAWREVANL